MINYNLERLTTENIHHLYLLFKNVYGKDAPTRFFHHKYDAKYIGQQYLGYFAMKNDVAVAYYGVIPIYVSIDNVRTLAAQACDAMTHPKHREMGLFMELLICTNDLAKRNGVKFIFGFPNQHSFHTLLKAGFYQLETMNRYTADFQDNLIRKIRRKIQDFKSNDERPVFENQLISEGFDGIIYDKLFLDYKKCNPNFTIKNNGVLFWLSKFNGIMIGSVLLDGQTSIINHINDLAMLTNASSITFITSPGTVSDFLFSKGYLPTKSFPVMIKELTGGITLKKLKFQLADIDIF